MRGFCLLVSLFASLSEGLVDSTLFNLHVDETNVSKPRFSWTLISEDTQTSYRIQVSPSHDRCSIIWDSGIVPSSSSLVEYAGPSLFPATHYFWTVDVKVSAGSGAVASSDFTMNYLRPRGSLKELSSRQVTNFGTLEEVFRTSTWIWTADGAPPLLLAPPGERYFRRTYIPPAGKTAMFAEVIITADNKFSLFVNGALVGVSPADADSWKNAQGYRLALGPGPVEFAVSATNAPTAIGGANAAGLLVGVRITHSDATQVLFGTDKTWRSNMLIVPSFQSPSLDDSKWAPATELEKFGQGPWGLLVALPTVLNAVSLPPVSTSSALPSTSSTLSPSSTSSSLPSTTSSSTTPSSSTTSSSALTSSFSVATVTSTSGSEDNTAPAVSPTSNFNDSSGTNPAVIGGALGGVLGAFALLGIGLLFWRRHKRAQDELVAADFDTWVPAAHANAPPMAQSPPPPSTLRQPHYPSSSDQYAQQAPYRYPPPSVSMASAAVEGSNGYVDQYGTGYGTSAGYGARGYGQNVDHEYGSSTQLVLTQNCGSNVPQSLAPGNSQRFYSEAGAGQNLNSSPYH